MTGPHFFIALRVVSLLNVAFSGAIPLEISSYNNYYRKELVSKMKIHCRWLLSCAAIALLTLTVQTVKATPYASCITNSGGNITFYLNESGGNVTVTYEDGSTNENFNGITTGVNLNAGSYTFSLTDHSILHTSYAISVYKQGSGSPSVISSPVQNANSGSGFFIIGDLRGVDVNKNPASPNFGRIYLSASARTAPAEPFYSFRSDGSFWSSNSAGITFVSGNASSPYRIGIAPDDYLMVGDFSTAGSAIWRVDPTLRSNQLVLGPIGVTAGQTAGTHGSEESRPVIINGGNLQSGGSATMLEIDGDYPTVGTNYNSILVYSNLTLSTLPDNTVGPSLVGPTIGLATFSGEYLGNVYPGLTVGTNGYIYTSNQRNNWAIPAVEIVDQTLTNVIWNSLYGTPNVGPDYFNTQVLGNGQYAPIDSAVSPDSAYFIAMAIDNHYTIVSLTNGIPDVRTLYTVIPTSLAQNGRAICWDAADNFYSISSGTAWAQAWTLGLTTTAITTGNASGTTGFQVIFPPDQISVVASAPAISQPNTYGNPTSTTFVINRAGPPTNAITVGYTFSGTALGATNGGVSYPAEFTANPPSSVTFGIGQTEAVVTVTSVSDSIPRPTTTLTLSLAPGAFYLAVTPKSATINILNTAPQELLVSQGSPTMYNAFSNDYCSLAITRWGDINASDYTVQGENFTAVGGTAAEGNDFTMPSAVTFDPGDVTNYCYIYPLVDGKIPVHTNVMAYTGNKTFAVSLVSASGYTAVANSNSFTIVDSANPPAPVLYYDPLTNSEPTNWNIVPTDLNYPNTAPDYFADFGYNLANDSRSVDQIPISTPPNGDATALRLTTGKTGVPNDTAYSGAVDLYLTNVDFSGDYAVRFNMNVSEPSSFATLGSFEGPIFGINCSGKATNWWANNSPSAPATTAGAETNWDMDGVWIWLTDSGDTEYYAYNLFVGGGATNAPMSIAPVADANASPFDYNFKPNLFTSTLPGSKSTGSSPDLYYNVTTMPVPGMPCNGSSDQTAVGSTYTNSWADVEIKQYNNVVTLSIDKITILSYVNTSRYTNGTIMLGYENPVFGGDGADGAVYYSDLKVVQLGPPAVSALAYNLQTSTLTFKFTTPDGSVTPSSFQVVGATAINGPYTTVSGATITQLNTPGAATFQATVPTSGAVHFYRLELNL